MTEGKEGEEPPLVLDPNAAREARAFESHEDQEKRLRNQALAQDIAERRKFAKRSFVLTCAWIVFIILSTVAQFVLNAFGKGLERSEFITLVTTTTGSVLGFWLLVGRYLFPSPSQPRDRVAAKVSP
jgi:hypothetical protein